MKKILKIIVCVSLLTLIGCSSSSGVYSYSDAEYVSSDKEKIIDDKFNESDMHKIVSTFTSSLKECKVPDKSKLILGDINNNTNEHIDLDMVLSNLRVKLTKNEKFVFLNKKERFKVNEELGFHDSGEVDPSQVIKKGQFYGSDYILTGDIHSNVQTFKDKKFVYYYVTINLTNLKTGMIDCTEEKELKKQFERFEL